MTYRLNDALWHGVLGMLVTFMLAPLVLLLMFSFATNKLPGFPVEGWTTDWYTALLARPQFWAALRNSAVVTGTVGVISTLLGTLAALGLSRLPRGTAVPVITGLTLPLMLPPLMLGVALLSFYSKAGIGLGIGAVTLSHLVFTQPFVLLVVAARMATFDHAAVESARDLGASPLRAFLDVTLPQIGPSIVGAALIAMAVSLDDFLVTLFTIGGGSTLPILMWGMLRKGSDPSINAIAAVLMLVSLAVSVIGLRMTRYRG